MKGKKKDLGQNIPVYGALLILSKKVDGRNTGSLCTETSYISTERDILLSSGRLLYNTCLEMKDIRYNIAL